MGSMNAKTADFNDNFRSACRRSNSSTFRISVSTFCGVRPVVHDCECIRTSQVDLKSGLVSALGAHCEPTVTHPAAADFAFLIAHPLTMQSLRRSLARAAATHMGASPTPYAATAAATTAHSAGAPLAAWLQPQRRRQSSTACSWPPKTAKPPDPVTEALAAEVVTACDGVLAAGGGAASPRWMNRYATAFAMLSETFRVEGLWMLDRRRRFGVGFLYGRRYCGCGVR